MTGMSGPNTPPNDFTGYYPPTSGPISGAGQPAARPTDPHLANPAAASGGGPPTGAPPPPFEPQGARQPGALSPAPSTQAAPRAAPATRPVTRSASRRGSTRGSREERNPNERFQALITAIGLAVGLLFVAGGGLLNATTSMVGLDPTATTTASGAPVGGHSTASAVATSVTLTPAGRATTTAVAPTASTTAGASASATATLRPTATTGSGTATPTATATLVPAKLSISPPSPIPNATCAANSALTTLNLSNSGEQSLDWTAAVDSTYSGIITLSDSTGTISRGHLDSNGTDTVSVNNTSSNAISGTSITINFTTTPSSAGPVKVTISCA